METLFLGCFLFGALLTLVAVLLGAGGVTGLHIGHDGLSHGPGPPHGAHTGHGAGVDADGAGAPHGLPLFNLTSLLAFLTWFGAAGWLLNRLTAWPVPVILSVAVLIGGVGSAVVAAFLRLVLAGERTMDPAAYRLEGTIARVTVSIPAGGIGEIVFSKAGTRRGEAARSLGGGPVPRGTEVVVVGYEGGVATVQPWSEFIGRDLPEGSGSPQVPGAEKGG